MVTTLSRAPGVEYAELDYQVLPLLSPNDPHFADKQWGRENTGQTIVNSAGTPDADVDASTAWEVSTGTTSGSSVPVAILDSGLDQDHEDLSSEITAQKNFTGSDTVP